MTKIIVVTSGKGGVGKTTSSASIAMGLAKKGKKTAVIDFDIGLRNLDLIMGCERRVIYDFVNVINEEARLNQALIKDKNDPNLFVLPASQTKDKDALTKEGVEKVFNQLKDEKFDYIVCDSPAGIETGALTAMYLADIAIIVTNPEVSSVRDSDRIVGMLDCKTKASENNKQVEKHLLITRFNTERAEKAEMLSIEDIEDLLRIPLIGIISESPDVVNASNIGKPVILTENSDAGLGYADMVERLLGNDVPMVIHKANDKKGGFFKKLFGG